MARPPAPPLPLTKKERSSLEGIAASVSLPHRAVREAKGLLMAGDGIANTANAEALGVSRSTVLQWREHFEVDGVSWVGKVHEGRGRKPVITQDQIDKMIDDTRTTTPPDATHWSNRTMAEHSGLSRTTVQREWKARGLKPHLVKTFKISNDPHFEDKLIDVVGLYLNPPDNAIVLSFDEKSQIQALDRTQPSLPMKQGRPGTVTHDYKRNGTTTLFAALNVLTGELIGQRFSRHRHQEFLSFLKLIGREVPKGRDIHIVLDNHATHKHENVAKWLDKHKRFHLHFTPTSSSWLNWVERWFKDITTTPIRRGGFGNVWYPGLCDVYPTHPAAQRARAGTAAWSDLGRVPPLSGQGHLGDGLLHRRHRHVPPALRAIRHRDPQPCRPHPRRQRTSDRFFRHPGRSQPCRRSPRAWAIVPLPHP
jgi:transposase